jgi:hypothetical protein
MRTLLLLTFFVAVTGQSIAQQSDESKWNEWRFLLGKWVAEGGGQPGQASAGGYSFDFDLQGKVLIRRNYSEYPATASKPPFRHDARAISQRGEDHLLRAGRRSHRESA